MSFQTPPTLAPLDAASDAGGVRELPLPEDGVGPAVIELRRVVKRFRPPEQRAGSLRQHFVAALRPRPPAAKPSFTLRDVSLAIQPGETWALLGRNGSGKSTLLRLLAGIYWPSAGEVITRGRTAALIELTAGFHPDLTGRENVYLYGAILGMGRAQVGRRYEAIVAFAGTEEYMETPIKYFSTGMRMRLGFAVATAVEPDILLLDEILAVGDAAFRERCLERIRCFQAVGCTTVMATHDLDAALEFAEHAIWLEDGRIRMQGPVGVVVDGYQGSFSASGSGG